MSLFALREEIRRMKVLIVRSPKKYIKLSEVEVNQIKNVRWDNVSGGYNCI